VDNPDPLVLPNGPLDLVTHAAVFHTRDLPLEQGPC